MPRLFFLPLLLLLLPLLLPSALVAADPLEEEEDTEGVEIPVEEGSEIAEEVTLEVEEVLPEEAIPGLFTVTVGATGSHMYRPHDGCFDGDTSLQKAFGADIGQCGQACAMLIGCKGFNIFRSHAGENKEGSCVMATDKGKLDSCEHKVWFYERLSR